MKYPKLTNSLSNYPILLTMVSAEPFLKLAVGTGFIYEYEDEYFLITNGHNVTGVNPETNQRLPTASGFQHAAFPTHILRQHRFNSSATLADELMDKLLAAGINPEHATFVPPENEREQATGKTTLYKDDDYTQPKWYIHPVHGYSVDVIAIPIGNKYELPKYLEWNALNKSPLLKAEPWIADDVYILGYPFGITNEMELPVWKKGSIASEPNLLIKGLPKMLVGTATRAGMSGSPVILKRAGIHGLIDGKMVDTSSIGTVFGFVGVYSGRIGAEDELSAQLGIVWHKEVIEEILVAKIQGTTDFQRV